MYKKPNTSYILSKHSKRTKENINNYREKEEKRNQTTLRIRGWKINYSKNHNRIFICVLKITILLIKPNYKFNVQGLKNKYKTTQSLNTWYYMKRYVLNTYNQCIQLKVTLKVNMNFILIHSVMSPWSSSTIMV